MFSEYLAPKKTKEKLEGKAARATDKAATNSRDLPDTERKRGSKKTTEVAERQNTWRILSDFTSIWCLWSMAIHSAFNRTPYD